ncbi:MAG: MBL fold metallo-hydrolase, partial [Gemmatimonadetes bacterium]|nr:MBL fold metallo-hydrolase [Gemmatimonadota bacterium]
MAIPFARLGDRRRSKLAVSPLPASMPRSAPDAAAALVLVGACVLALFFAPLAAQETQAGGGLRVVILGTGTPNADPDRWGPSVAVLFGDRSYIVDAGPGVVRRAAAAAREHDEPSLQADRLGRVFLSHLHSDHTVGLPDLLLSPWVLDRPGPLRVTGPTGTSEMMEGIENAWRRDIDMRLYGLEPREANPDAFRAQTRETRGGVVLEEDGLTVTAIPV